MMSQPNLRADVRLVIAQSASDEAIPFCMPRGRGDWLALPFQRHCERSEAIHIAEQRKEWIASLRSQ
jgi:hypothetical protein